MKTLNYLKIAFFYLFVFICALSVSSALVYRIFNLNLGWSLLSFFSAASITYIIFLFFKKNNLLARYMEPFRPVSFSRLNLVPGTAYLLLAGLIVLELFLNRTESAMVSPWQACGAGLLLLYFLASLVLASYLSLNNNFGLLLIIIHFLLSFSVGAVIFKIGFGYDLFIHEAALKAISESGQILPKTNYYLGYYGIITVLDKVLFLPFDWLNKYFVHLAAGIYIPFFLRLSLARFFEKKVISNLAILALLAFTYPIFVFSTPQNLAFLFLLISVFLALEPSNKASLVLLGLTAASSFAVHPIAGIPAFIIFGFTLIYQLKSPLKNSLTRLFFFSAASVLPAAFMLVNAGFGSEKPESAADSSSLLASFLAAFSFKNPDSENILLNTLYLIIENYPLIFLGGIAYGLAVFFKNRRECGPLRIHILSGLALLASFFLIANLDFSQLISYERGDYAYRVLIAALLCLLPILVLAVYHFLKHLESAETPLKIVFISFLPLALTVSFYASYPRQDNYHDSHLYSVSRHDLEAVRWIETDADNSDIVVLANQQVSAAALKEFGFKKYYRVGKEDIFYYPIPTGGTLYRYYLDMVYQYPSAWTMDKAKGLTGAQTAYFVLNKYWWASPKLFEEAKSEAESWKIFGNNDVAVFKY